MCPVIDYFGFHCLVLVPYPNKKIRAKSSGTVYYRVDYNNCCPYYLSMLWRGPSQSAHKFHIFVYLYVRRSFCSCRKFLDLQRRRSYNGCGDNCSCLPGSNFIRISNKMGFHYDGWYFIRRHNNIIHFWNRCYFRPQQNCSVGICIFRRFDIFCLFGL